MFQAVKVKVSRDNEKPIVNLNPNKGPVLYPTAAKQTMNATNTSTTTGQPPNTTYVYQKGFLPIPMATLETTTARQPEQQHPLKLQPVQQERRTGFSTVSQEIEEQIPSTQVIQPGGYDIDEHQEFYEERYKEQIPLPKHTHLFHPEIPEKHTVPPYRFESIRVEDQVENNEIMGNHHYHYGDFKEYQFPENHHIEEHNMPKNEHKEQPQHES